MPEVLEPADLLVSEAQLQPLAEVLSLPPDRLLGVPAEARATLEALGIATIFDLAMSRVFNAAAQIVDAALNPANAMNRFGRPITDLLKPGIAGTVAIADLRNQPLDVLADIDDAAAVKATLGVLTVRDLAVYPPFRAARQILNRAFFPEQLEDFDPERPGDLVPKSGEFPTERVQYTSLILDSLLRPDNAPPLIDVASAAFQPIDAALVADENFGFNTIGLGMLLTMSQSWFMQNVTLGHLLHSMALAAGESTRIAVVDWSRKVSAGQTELLGETEDLSQDTSRNRSISEVTQAVADEAQSGFSHTESKSTTKQGGGSFGLAIPSIGLGLGGSGSAAKTSTSADSYSTSAGHREIGASMLQNASDRTHQHAHAARTRRASVVREVSQTEHENVSTRVVTNYNHMHALTVQYYEVVQIYRTETSITKCDRVVFVPFKLIDFSNANLLRRFRGALIDAALTPQVRDALVNFDTLELVPERRVPFTALGGPITGVLATSRVLVRPTALARRRDTEPGDTEPGPGPDIDEEPPRPPRPPRPPSGGNDIADTLWENAASRLSTFFGTPAVRRNSESLFLPSDVHVHEGAVQSSVRTIKLVFVLRDGTRIVDLSSSIPLVEVDRIALIGSDPAADVNATGVLAMSRNGVVFPLELPTVTVPRGANETRLLDVRAAGADVNLVQHLADNRLHYSQAVFRTLDAAMIAGLLSPFSIRINGTDFPLVQVAEPVPLRIVGNALAFKINTDPVNDQEWRDFMASRGITIGQAKVDIVPLSSGGIFAEAVLGRSNSAEKLDLSRFFNWQDSPIPIQPSDIAAIQTGTRATQENLTPGQFSAPLVSITPPAALPDPTGLAGTLAAIQSGNLFRDMSGLADTIKLAGETAKLSGAGASSAATQATEAMKAAVDLAKAKLGKPLGDKNQTEQGAVVNKEEELKKKQQAEAKKAQAAGGGGTGSGGAAGGDASGGGSGGSTVGGGGTKAGSTPPAAPRTTGSSALDQIIGNEDTLRPFIGLAADSPEPAPAVTAEGVPLQELDSVGTSITFVQATEGDESDLPTRADLDEIIAKGLFKADTTTMESLTLGDRKIPGGGFGGVLRRLSLAPVGSVRTLNIAVHCTSTIRLDYSVDWTFIRGTNRIDHSFDTFIGTEPLFSPDMSQLIALLSSPELTVNGVLVKLSDVRKAFPADGEVRIFNMSNPLHEDFLQVLANVFQVRTSAFVRKPVRVRPTIVAELEDGSFALSKKVDIGFIGDPPGTEVDFFPNLLTLDRATTGLFTAFPRRP